MSGEPPLEELYPHPASDGITAIEYAELVTERSGSSFSAGMAILPKPRREAMRSIYAFCRVVDDIADGDFTVSEKYAALDAWRVEIDQLFAGNPASAIGEALLPAIRDFALPKAEFLQMIDGMAMDADGPIIAPDRERLALYTRRVAGSVGIMSMHAFGAWRGEVSQAFALALGDAFQLTNILRDIESDAEIGRLYLPREMLQRYGLPVDDPAEVARHPVLFEVCRELGLEARSYYDQARLHATAHNRAELRPALLMMGAYEGYPQSDRRPWLAAYSRTDAVVETPQAFLWVEIRRSWAWKGEGSSMSGTIHIVGAGLAGLSAALHAMSAGQTVCLYEGAGHAGGRCRSFFDERLQRYIDNGNHLVFDWQYIGPGISSARRSGRWSGRRAGGFVSLH